MKTKDKTGMVTVEKLTTDEALSARKMWSEIFSEDSERFTDYYFAEKMAENKGYGVKCDNRLCAMLFLTPYMGQVLAPDKEGSRFRDIPLCYIVGVGTRQEYRHRGYMDRLLRTALSDLCQEAVPFAFLMPADPAIYTPYQFRYIYDRPTFSIEQQSNLPAQIMQEEESAALAAFAEGLLEQRYQLFLRRDEAYYRRQKKESQAQNGDIYLWKEQGEIAGFYLSARENGKEEIQEGMVADGFAKRETLRISSVRQPIIMARITNVASMLCLLRLSGQAEPDFITVCFRLFDPLLREQSGTFLWTVGKKESTIAMLTAEDEAEVCTDISALTEFVFGRKDCRDCFWEDKQTEHTENMSDLFADLKNDTEGGYHVPVYKRLSQIIPLRQVCINEIV